MTDQKTRSSIITKQANRRLDRLYARVKAVLQEARSSVVRSIDTAMVQAYWLIGREIIEEEQLGQRRAGYGEEVIDQLSKRLKAAVGKGFTPGNLRYMRLFYGTYPRLLDEKIRHATRDKSWEVGRLNPALTWTHYRLLTKVESLYARAFYEIEMVRNRWASRELRAATSQE